MNFNSFWKWLCRQTRRIETLGRRRRFKIQAAENTGTIISSTGRTHYFSKDTASKVLERYESAKDEIHRAGHYVDGHRKTNWKKCPNRICSPWVAAAIRDFESENKL